MATIKRAAMMARDRRKTECSKPTAGFVSRQHGPDKPCHALRPSGPRNDERLRSGVTSKRRSAGRLDAPRLFVSGAGCHLPQAELWHQCPRLDIRSRGAGLLEHKRALH